MSGAGTSWRGIDHAMHQVAERILPGQPLTAVIDHLDHDPHADDRR